MRKSGFIMLVVMLLSFSALVAAESPDGYSNSLENILYSQEEVISNAVSVSAYENEAFLACSSEQEYSIITTMSIYTGLEVGNTESLSHLSGLNNTMISDLLRGEHLNRVVG